MSHVTYEWVMSHVHESCHELCDSTEWHVTWLIDVCRDPFICDMTHSYVSHESFIGVTSDIKHSYAMCICILDMTHSYVTWLIHMWHDLCEMTHSYVTWLIHMWHDLCEMTHSYVTWWMHFKQSTHGGDQIWNFWISRLSSFPGFYSEWRELRLLKGNPVWNFVDSRETCLIFTGTPLKTYWKFWQS